MSFPLYDLGLPSGLLAGLLFGYALEAAGFGSPRKLTAQFSLRDFAVFKVMFTAVLVAAIGLYPCVWRGHRASFGLCPDAILLGDPRGRADDRRRLRDGRILPRYLDRRACLRACRRAGFHRRDDRGHDRLCLSLRTADLGSTSLPRAPTPSGCPTCWACPNGPSLPALVAIAALGFALGSRLERARGGSLTAQEVCAEDTETLATPKGAMARS
ncbi:MAG: hypothetical protein M9957_03165 [Rhodobacteraceae bacterium]|nr:hypothetical protein [Paracoccaceae bacterium]